MEQQTFSFTDVADGDETVLVVRHVDGGVAIAVSKRRDGDMETIIPRADVERIAEALRAAAQ